MYTVPGASGVNIDGYVREPAECNATEEVWVGDSGNQRVRGFVGFDISSIHSTIISATLKLYQVSIDEGAPYTLLGNLIVDHVNFGTSLDSGDLTGNTLTNNIGTISNNANLLEWKTLDVKNYVQADISAGRTSSQFRIRFTTNTAAGNNWVTFEDADNYKSTGNKPELVVTYY